LGEKLLIKKFIFALLKEKTLILQLLKEFSTKKNKK